MVSFPMGAHRAGGIPIAPVRLICLAQNLGLIPSKLCASSREVT